MLRRLFPKRFPTKPTPRTARSLRLETLEARWCPAAFSFVGGAAGAANSWSTGSNWQVAGVAQTAPPGATDDVTIQASKTVYFDVGASVTIQSLTMLRGCNLNLGKVTAGGLSLTVTGGNSTLGEAVPNAKATIYSSNPAQIARNAALKFTGAQDTVSLTNVSFSFAINAANGNNQGMTDLVFSNKAVNLAGPIITEAKVSFTGAVITTVNTGLETWDIGRYGSLTAAAGTSIVAKSGVGILKDPLNRIDFANKGRIIIDVGPGKTFKIQPKITGGTTIERTGTLGAVFQGDGTTQLVLWSGTALDGSDGTTTLGMGDSVHFVSNGDTTGVTMQGAFDFEGSTEAFHAYTLAQPDDDALTTWTLGGFGTTAVSYAVHVQPDDNGVASWTGNGDAEIFDLAVTTTTTTTTTPPTSPPPIDPGLLTYTPPTGSVTTTTTTVTTLNEATLSVTGSYSEHGGTFATLTTGTPPTGTNVALIQSTQSLDLAFSAYNDTPWTTWTPDAYDFGVHS